MRDDVKICSNLTATLNKQTIVDDPFASVPLLARLAGGVDQVTELVSKQQKIIANLSIKAKSKKDQPADARLEMKSTGLLRVKFTDTIKNLDSQNLDGQKIQTGRYSTDDCNK